MRSSRREEILRARKQEKLRWQVLDVIKSQCSIDVNNQQVHAVVAGVVERTEPQLQGMPPMQVVERLVPYCMGDLKTQGLVFEPVPQVQKTSHARFQPPSSNGVENMDMYLPYNAKAGQADPYAAMQLYTAEVARREEEKWKKLELERKLEQRRDLVNQMEQNRKRNDEAKKSELIWGVNQREAEKEYQKQQRTEMNTNRAKIKEERYKQKAYQEEWREIQKLEKSQALNTDLAYLKRVDDEILAAKQRDIELVEQRRREAEETMISNNAQRAKKMADLQREKDEDKERMRQWEAQETAKEARRRADLENMKKYQATLMDIGNEAVERQRELDRITDMNIQKAIDKKEEKARLAAEASAQARARMIQETNEWRAKEAKSRADFLAQEKFEEDERIRKMQEAFKLAEEEAIKKKVRESQAKAQYKTELMRQMQQQREAKRRNMVEMSPHEAAVNADVLKKFRPNPGGQYTQRGTSLARAGGNIIF